MKRVTPLAEYNEVPKVLEKKPTDAVTDSKKVDLEKLWNQGSISAIWCNQNSRKLRSKFHSGLVLWPVQSKVSLTLYILVFECDGSTALD